MKTVLLQENFVSALKQINRIVPNKPQLPILQTIKIEATPTELQLTATDLQVGMQIDVPAQTENPGSMAVPARVLVDTIQALPPGQVTLELDEHRLTVTTEKTKTNITTQPVDDFPEFVSPEGVEISITNEQIENIKQLVSFCATTDLARPVLATVGFMQKENGTELVATDGYRLAMLHDENITMPSEKVLIPISAFNEIVKLSQSDKQENTTLQYSEEQQQLFVTVGQTRLFTRLVEGAYPPYQKIVPDSCEYHIRFDGETFARYVKQSMIFSRQNSSTVQMKFGVEALEITGNSTNQGSFQAELPFTTEKDSKTIPTDVENAITIAFNGNYLLDFLNSVKPETIIFKMNEPLKPAIFMDPDQENWQYVVMPFRLNQA